jgi:hypothetical protein
MGISNMQSSWYNEVQKNHNSLPVLIQHPWHNFMVCKDTMWHKTSW